MAIDAEEVVVGASGRVYVGPTDATFPDDATTAPTGFTDVGFTSEDGVTFTDSKDVEDVPAWQSLYPIRRIVTGKTTTLEMVLRQWNPDTVALAFGGGSVDTATGTATYTPPLPGEIDFRAMIVDWVDGDRHFRLVVPRGMVTGEVSAQVTRTQAADLPVAFSATPAGVPDADNVETFPWYLITDDPAFIAA